MVVSLTPPPTPNGGLCGLFMLMAIRNIPVMEALQRASFEQLLFYAVVKLFDVYSERLFFAVVSQTLLLNY
eukprot:NODE_12417_length_280_cov_10.761905_g11504_i0.p1 GENE.NODE_12417_length_280_cov_10.761905_g11504_i0~~NODE_12417_length_280_cov_10.761905_g11504_i0.p1  ORF type:complete len:71 (+),score=5.90 NODE_12417_length_280_cov_10.761905_g11504_i0:40-252(+)